MITATLVYVFVSESRPARRDRAENQMQALQMSMAFILPSDFLRLYFPARNNAGLFYGLGAILPDLLHRLMPRSFCGGQPFCTRRR
jgi:hypothetical protein